MNGKYIIQAIKQIYPDIQGGFQYWETQYDGTAWKNSIDGLVWENKDFKKPTWDQINAQLGMVELQFAKDTKKQELINLKSTQVTENLMQEIQPIIDVINSLKTVEEVEAFDITKS